MIKTILPLLILIILTIIKTVLAQNYAIPAPTDIPGFPQPNSTNSTQGPTQGPNYEYTKLLAYSLYFYEAQRSGKLPPNNRVSWRHDSALSDGSDVNLDLTGGYYDAGDHLKFTFPLSWTITSLSWGAYEWYDGYVAANQTTEIRDMIKWGTDWLIKAHSDQSVLYVMIGSENIDHNYWGPDTDIPYPRPSLQINSTARGTDAAAEAAAAMAAASLFFKDKVQDIEYSNILFNHSQQLYDLASITPFVTYQTSVPEVNNLYASTTYNDELVWSSLWLYKLTKNATYFDIAAGYFKQFQLSGNNDVINWDSKTGATYILFVQCAIELNRNDVDTWKAEAERYLDTVASQSDRCKLTKGGLFYCNGDSDAASLNPALNAAFASLLYSNLSSTTSKRDSYIDFAMSQINYLLGKNPMKIPYVVGVHPNSPQNPHHSGAQGGNDINGPTLNIIYGGIVGGPDKHDKYKDKRADYIQSEVALDYNAPFQNIMAYQVINSQDDPYYVTLPPGRGSVSELNVALVVSLVVIGVLIIVGICIFIYWRKKRGKSINIFRCFKK